MSSPLADFDGAVRIVDEEGNEKVLYQAEEHQITGHLSEAPNFLAWGTRGTGKSTWLRWDAIIRCLLIPNFRALIVRRTMPELRQSHLFDIPLEMKMLGGVYLETTFTAKFPNGSVILFRHCETEKDVMNFLSSQYGFVGFDEISTFSLEQFLKISGVARAPKEAGYKAVVRCASNPLGMGAKWMKQWFIDKKVNFEDFPDYNPADFDALFSTLRDNSHIDADEYEKRLKNLPEHVRRAWLNGEFVIEGAYFTDFRPFKDKQEWHVIHQVPLWRGRERELRPIFTYDWIQVYRAIDWGFWPDPAVCLWIAVLPNGRAIVFKEKHWFRKTATEVARDIKRESAGMNIAQSFCDPSMFINTGQTDYSIGEFFENEGVPLEPSVNKRELYGYAIHQYLNTIVDDLPQVQILEGMCPDLLRTLPAMEMDLNDPAKLADGEDHWVVALAYFCMGSAPPSQDPHRDTVPFWLRPKSKRTRYHRP